MYQMQRKDRVRMKIGIVSDSHKKIDLLKEAIERLKNDGAEYLIHAGDIVLKESLDILKESKLPYQAVIGNNDTHLIKFLDDYNLFQEPHYFKIGNIEVKLMHLPHYLNNDAKLIIYGHTHYFDAKVEQGTLYINPGEICARKKPLSEFVMIENEDDFWMVNYYRKDINSSSKKYKVSQTKLDKVKS